MKTFNPTINDWMIRLVQLESTLGRITCHVSKPLAVEDSIRAEMKHLKTQIEGLTELSYSNGTWRT